MVVALEPVVPAPSPAAPATIMVIVIREYDPKTDITGVEEMERSCEVGPTGKTTLFTDLMGDPVCRVRHSPAFHMLVAELVVNRSDEIEREIVGTIRGSIKTVTCGVNPAGNRLLYAKLGYILGLRVSPSHRRMGIGLNLVEKIEEWFKENRVEYSYMATEKDNSASVNLFTNRCGYSKFRTPSILIQPVFAHHIRISKRVTVIKLEPSDAELFYRRRFSTTEFFPTDIDAVLNNPLSLGTFLAFPKDGYSDSWPGSDKFLDNPPESWAVLSVWNVQFRLEVRGVSSLKKWLARRVRSLDRAFPWMRIPSVPEFFRPFGIHFVYGLGGEGEMGEKLVKELCGVVHNLAKERGGGVVATEVSAGERLRKGIPHWKSISCPEDLWCIKKLGNEEDDDVGDWTKSPPGLSVFVDPREV